MSTDSCHELRRGHVRASLFFQKPGFHWSKMCAQATRVSVYLSAFAFLSAVFIVCGLLFFCSFFFFASRLLCFLGKAGVFVGSSVVLYLLFPLSFLRVYHVHSVALLFLFSLFLFCFYYEYILAEDLYVHLPLLFISLSFSGRFHAKEVFLLCLHLCTGCQRVRMYCISESFGRSGYSL